jgi:N6-adenosine-specific RNA methylase IME4
MKKNSIVYADPPWRFGSRGVRSGEFGELDYDDMSTEEICSLDVKSICRKNAALFLWSTSAHLMEDAPRVIRAWGFKPVRVEAVWKKIKASGKPHAACGPWGMTDAEFLLMGVRGSMCSKQIGKRNLYTVVESEFTGTHSEKPAIFRDRIVERFGKRRRCELFAREKVKGWRVWGKEVINDFEIEFLNEI